MSDEIEDGERIAKRMARAGVASRRDAERMIEAGRVGPIVDRVLPMESAAEAHRLVETEERCGAIVLAIGEPTAC